MIDLHTHSKVSDGILNPKDLIFYGASKGVSIMALTDHDTVDGLEEAQNAADEKGILFVPGVELNVEWPTGEFHLLGLGLNNISASLKDIIEKLQKGRENRNLEIVKKMQADGYDVCYDEIITMAGSSCIGRPHFAQYFIQKKLVKNRQQAFDKFLAKGRPYYVDRFGCNLQEAINAIQESNGAAVLAHPLSLYVSWGKIEGVLSELKELGVQGIEAFHPGARVSECKRLYELGKKLGFVITAGSDFHGEGVRADRHIGRTAGDEKIDEKFWNEELEPFLRQIRENNF